MGVLENIAKRHSKVKTTSIDAAVEKELKQLILTYLKRDNSPARKKLLKEYKNGAPLIGTDGLRKKLGALDLEFFGKAYFSHYFSRETPIFHRELDDIWQTGVMKGLTPDTECKAIEISKLAGCKRAIAAPRGHAKSTNLTFKDTIHAVVYQYKRYPIIISDSSEQAESFLENIKVEFEENQAIKEDFGNLQGKVWRNNVLLINTGIKIEAIGSGKKIRGRKHRNFRPDLLILDDIENDENVATLEQRKKLANWFYKAVSKAGDSYTDIIYIGTLLHYDSLLAKVLKNPSYKTKKYKAVLSFAKHSDLWDAWSLIYTDLLNENHENDASEFFNSNKEEMLEGTQVLWGDKLSYYDLMVMKVSEGDASFNSEMQNEPINPDDCLFKEDWFRYYNEVEIELKDSRFEFIGFVDPSLGKNRKSDLSTIIIIARDKKSGLMYVIDADIERRHPDKIITDVLEKEKWLRTMYGRGFTLFGCETNQFQWFLKEALVKASAEAKLYIPVEEVNQTSNKALRIATLQPDIKNGYLLFNPRLKKLIEYVQYFPMAANDDPPDALEACRTLCKKAISSKVEYESGKKRIFTKKGAY